MMISSGISSFLFASARELPLLFEFNRERRVVREFWRRLIELLEQLGNSTLALRILAIYHRLGVVFNHNIRIYSVAIHRPFSLRIGRTELGYVDAAAIHKLAVIGDADY